MTTKRVAKYAVLLAALLAFEAHVLAQDPDPRRTMDAFMTVGWSKLWHGDDDHGAGSTSVAASGFNLFPESCRASGYREFSTVRKSGAGKSAPAGTSPWAARTPSGISGRRQRRVSFPVASGSCEPTTAGREVPILEPRINRSARFPRPRLWFRLVSG